jgi:hypothetical protein
VEGSDCCYGCTLDTISSYTTDNQWKRSFIDRTGKEKEKGKGKEETGEI